MMRRRLTAMVLLVSFVAMATSGLLMLIVDKPSFTMRMHPVHKLFGLALIAGALSHIQLNARAIGAHLKDRRAAIAAAALTAVLTAAYALVALNPLPAAVSVPLDEAAQRAESHGADVR